MMWLLGAMTLLPLSGSLTGALCARTRATGAVTAASSAGTLALALAVVVRSLSGPAYVALGDYVYVDALSAAVIALVGTLGLAALPRSTASSASGSSSRASSRGSASRTAL